MKSAWPIVIAIVALAFVPETPVAAQTPWIHVEVDEEKDENPSHVTVNLPLSVVQVAIEAAPEKFISNGELHLRHVDKDIEIEDLRRVWLELRKSGDAEFVTVEERDETVRVRRDGEFIRIDVTDRGRERSEDIHVEIPVSVVDALFSGEGETLNIKEALSELSSQRGDIVRVDDGETKVRVWIDERN